MAAVLQPSDSAIQLPLRQIEAAENIEPMLTKEQSDRIGADVVLAFEEDKQSRKEWETRSEEAIKLALQMVEEKSFPWPKASNVKFPLVTIAALQFAARAYPALVKAPDLVRYRVMGEDPDGAKASRAERISRHMSYQLLDQDEEWEEDADRAFIVIPIIGCAFKKTYWDALKGKNCSRLVLPQNLVVHYYTRTIEDCERKTEIFELYEREIKERQLKGLYSKKDLAPVQPKEVKLSDKRQGVTAPPVGKHTPREFLEQHCYLDLDGDGYPEPYIVTVDRSSKQVFRLKSRFGEVVTEQSLAIKQLTDQKKMLLLQVQDLVSQVPPPSGNETDNHVAAAQIIAQQANLLQQQAQALDGQIAQLQQQDKTAPTVLRIAPLECYTKCGFIPSPDGGFYDLGLGALLGPINDSVNTLINQLIDAGTLQNGSQGFIGKGARIQGGKVRFEPFEWKRVNVAGSTLRDSLVPLPINQPSTVLFQLLSMLINYGEKVSSVNDAMSGNNPGQNTPAYNMQAMLEQGLQVFNGIFKRLYRSFRKELRKLYVLNRVYLNPIDYYETMDGRFSVTQNDYTADEKDVLPAADPNAFSNMEHVLKAQFLAQRAGSTPGYNPAAVERRLLAAMDIPNVQEIYPVDEKGQPVIPPPQNPEIALKASEEQRRTLEAQHRMEISSATAQSGILVDQSNVMLNAYKAQELDANVEISQFQALTDRIAALAALTAAKNKKDAATAD
jgi:hypothetical protein